MPKKIYLKGFSLIEVLLAGGLIAILVTAFVGVVVYGRESLMLSGNRNRAVYIAEEGLEAVRNIRDNNFSNLVDGTYGLSNSGLRWQFSGSSDTVDIYNRSIVVSEVDSETKQIAVNVSWRQNAQRDGLIQLMTYLTNWQESSGEESCEAFAISEGYQSGVCRQNSGKCLNNDEEYLPQGDQYCGTPPNDTCCALPEDEGGGGISSCDDYAISQNYISGICRKNPGMCGKNGETHLSGGDEFCGAPNNTCCGQ